MLIYKAKLFYIVKSFIYHWKTSKPKVWLKNSTQSRFKILVGPKTGLGNVWPAKHPNVARGHILCFTFFAFAE